MARRAESALHGSHRGAQKSFQDRLGPRYAIPADSQDSQQGQKNLPQTLLKVHHDEDDGNADLAGVPQFGHDSAQTEAPFALPKLAFNGDAVYLVLMALSRLFAQFGGIVRRRLRRPMFVKIVVADFKQPCSRFVAPGLLSVRGSAIPLRPASSSVWHRSSVQDAACGRPRTLPHGAPESPCPVPRVAHSV